MWEAATAAAISALSAQIAANKAKVKDNLLKSPPIVVINPPKCLSCGAQSTMIWKNKTICTFCRNEQ